MELNNNNLNNSDKNLVEEFFGVIIVIGITQRLNL